MQLLFVGANISAAELLGHSCSRPAVCAYWRSPLLETKQSWVSVQQDVVGICCPGMCRVKRLGFCSISICVLAVDFRIFESGVHRFSGQGAFCTCITGVNSCVLSGYYLNTTSEVMYSPVSVLVFVCLWTGLCKKLSSFFSWKLVGLSTTAVGQTH